MNNIKDTNETVEKIAAHFEEIIKLLGEDTQREGLLKTPIRAAKALYKSTKGYRGEDALTIAQKAIFEHAGSNMIIVKDIEFYSFCEHHILPFFGRVSIGYIPNGKMIGLSKLARIVNVFAQRLQVQERLTAEVCQAVAKSLDAKGVIVACNAQHLCMKMRGVEKPHSLTTTSDFTGAFNRPETREEFMNLIRRG